LTPQQSACLYAAQAHVSQMPPRGPAAGAVIMLHGLGGDVSQFDPIVKHVHRPAYHMVRIDMRAHGATQLIGTGQDFTFGQFSLDVAALLDHLVCPVPLTGIGISMGAGVLAALAIAWPGRFRRLLLVRPAWEAQPSPAHLRPFQEVAALLGTHGPSEGARLFQASGTFLRMQSESAYAAGTLLREFASPNAVARRIRLERMPASTPFSSLRDLRAVTVHAEVIATPRDPLHPVAIAQHWAENLPQAAYHLIPPKTSSDERYARRLAERITASLDAARERA
jgi:pimeloyl-ACP methyl ester carboxylesterase